ncbi:DegT/DnrJ/EryC1/StrS family aminotransferase [candidate division KSB1 bacterium]|nr:DegT/DnrJ/EryC1/StrS family aminotransferase [candidate division KSB1 bacterium]
MAALNERRHDYVEKVEEKLKKNPGLTPVHVYPRAKRGGYNAFPVIHKPEYHHGLDTQQQAIRQEGLSASSSPYSLLHRLPLFAQGFDMVKENREPLFGDCQCYQEGDFLNSEKIFKQLLFLPMLSDPVPDAAEKIQVMLQRPIDRVA